jgi:hypothetical protein
MIYFLLSLWIATISFAIFLMIELDWRTLDWKNERYRGQLLPFKGC